MVQIYSFMRESTQAELSYDSWLPVIGQVPMYQKGCELRCLIPRVRQAQIHANQSCMLTDVTLVERFSVHCLITPGGQLTILM